jgi:hypothetical protein
MARHLRRIAFLGIAAYMLLSPAYVQVFGGRSGTVRSWRMFHKRGEGICSAIYYQDGKRLDRYALLGEQRRTAPDDFRRITDEVSARAMGRRICDHLGPTADVRLELRCGIKTGLRTIEDREQNLCRD